MGEKTTIDKIQSARLLTEQGIRLFHEGVDSVSPFVLAGAASGILEPILKQSDFASARGDNKDIIRIMNNYYN